MAEYLVTDPASFASRAAEQIGRALERMSETRRDVTLVLCGGKTVGPVYEHLAALRSVSLHWEATSFYFGDERAVPPEHRDSNYRLASETLLSRISTDRERIHRMEAEREDLEKAARDYEALLPSSLDVLLLGMGVDGHIASLFPGSDALAVTGRRVVPAFGGSPRVARLTITPQVLTEPREIMVMVSGSAKAPAVSRALEGPLDPIACPPQLVRHATWILDEAAARGLRAGSSRSDGRSANPGSRP